MLIPFRKKCLKNFQVTTHLKSVTSQDFLKVKKFPCRSRIDPADFISQTYLCHSYKYIKITLIHLWLHKNLKLLVLWNLLIKLKEFLLVDMINKYFLGINVMVIAIKCQIILTAKRFWHHAFIKNIKKVNNIKDPFLKIYKNILLDSILHF